MAAASSTPPLVAALVGEDSFLQLSALRDLLRLLPPDSQRVDLDGETASLADARMKRGPSPCSAGRKGRRHSQWR